MPDWAKKQTPAACPNERGISLHPEDGQRNTRILPEKDEKPFAKILTPL